jgi:iron complex transport system substrate-binding protein
MLRSCLLASLLVLPGIPVFAQEAAQRIVSMNLCTDQLLLLLVDRSRIASLSYLAADPAYSPLAAQARGLPLNHGQAEEVLAAAPDLILTSQFSASFTAGLLERRGYAVHRFGFANDLDAVAAQIGTLGALTGTEARATQLVADIRAQVADSTARLRPLLGGGRAVFLSNNGFVYGADTLQDAFLRSLDLVNVAAASGLRGPASMNLEALLAAAPTVVFVPPATALDAQLAHPLLRHPVWRRLAGQVRRITLEDRWFDCAGPQLAQAYAALERELVPGQASGTPLHGAAGTRMEQEPLP